MLKMCVWEKCKIVVRQQTQGVSPVYGEVWVHSGLYKVCMVQIQARVQ